MNELTGKTAIITGASKGIGAATVKHFANLGVNVVMAARSTDKLKALQDELTSSKGKVLAYPCDVSSYSDVCGLIEACQEQFGRLDILINNAGMIEPICHLADSDPETWTRTADINYKGVYYGLRAALPVMLKQGQGVIINISSGAAVKALEGWSHYCSSKAAVHSLTKCADLEYKEQGIRILALSPGTVATDMQVAIKASGVNPVSQLEVSDHIVPDDVGKALAWLCSDAAKDISGEDFQLREEANRKLVGL